MKLDALLVIGLCALLLVAFRAALGVVWRRHAAARETARRGALAEQARARAALAPRRLTLPELRTPIVHAPAVLRRRPAPTRHPILLAHGYLGFDSIGVARSRREYFRGVRGRLEASGYSVHVARVAPAASVVLRAAQLKRQIDDLGADRVNIIAHSMGGLDARYAISRLGLGDRVASLTTVGTPHRGTPIADTGAQWLGEWRSVRRILDSCGANIDGLYDLTTERMAAFNGAVLDAPGVLYSSVIGAVERSATEINALLAPGYSYLRKTSGSNDGIVPADSQRWGQVIGHVDADHWEQIGWFGSFDAARFYAVLAEHLADWGL